MEIAETVPRSEFIRTWDFADVAVRSDGGGRTVEAIVTPFETPTPVRDADGHYNETIGRTAFRKTLAERGLNFQVLFNHGRTYDGRTDGSLMVPIGVPRELTDQHERGLYSATEFLDNPLADAVLDGVKKGAIRGYSFMGAFMKSQRTRPVARGDLPMIHRSEISMREYGPGLFPVHPGAGILGTRTQSFLDELANLDPEDVDRFRQMLGIATPLEPVAPVGTSPEAAAHAQTDPAATPVATAAHPNLRALIASRNRTRRIA